MTYATLMVHLQLGRPNAGLLLTASNLAERFQAGVIGVAACQPIQLVYSDGYIAGDVFERDREQKDKEIRDAEAEFRTAFRARANTLEWRSTVTLASTSEWVVDEARSADLVITGVAAADMFDPGHCADVGELVMRAGRPVLVVPPGAGTPRLEHAMIGWKDTRETRRAVADALPLLQKMTCVTVAEVAGKDDLAAARSHVGDVAGWLARHGVMADTLVAQQDGDDAAQLDSIARDRGADLVVAGAYGHSRLREWALGGVTRSLLKHLDRCSLLSH